MASDDPELCYLPATEVLKNFKARTLSPVEYLEELIKRAEETEPVINAFAFTWFDEAMDQARNAEAKYTGRMAILVLWKVYRQPSKMRWISRANP